MIALVRCVTPKVSRPVEQPSTRELRSHRSSSTSCVLHRCEEHPSTARAAQSMHQRHKLHTQQTHHVRTSTHSSHEAAAGPALRREGTASATPASPRATTHTTGRCMHMQRHQLMFQLMFRAEPTHSGAPALHVHHQRCAEPSPDPRPQQHQLPQLRACACVGRGSAPGHASLAPGVRARAGDGLAGLAGLTGSCRAGGKRGAPEDARGRGGGRGWAEPPTRGQRYWDCRPLSDRAGPADRQPRVIQSVCLDCG